MSNTPIAVDHRKPADIQITVSDSSSRFTIDNPTRDVGQLLYDELAYFKDGAEWSDAYKSGRWDGFDHLYNKSTHSAPIGLLTRATSLLESHGHAVTVDVKGDRSPESIDTRWRFDYDLRDYQRDAVDAVLQAGGGIVAIPTGGGKSVVALKLIESIGLRAIVFVHTGELLHQWARKVRETLDVEPGVIGDGDWSEGPVTVATMQTLESRGPDDLDGYGVAVFDECHRTSAAETFHDVGMEVDAPWRIGLSATPWRQIDGEELKIEGAVGGVAVNVTAAELIEQGHLARPVFHLVDPEEYGQTMPAETEDYQDVYRRHVEYGVPRNRAVASTAADLAADGYRVLVSVDRLAQGHLLHYALSEPVTGRETVDALKSDDDTNAERAEKVYAVRDLEPVGDYGAAFLHGTDDTEDRQAVLASFEAGDVPILISTLLKEGVDLPSINAVVLAEGKKSDTQRIQTVGRALRPANGEHAVIADVRDRGAYLGEHFEARREAFSDYYGKFGPSVDDTAGRGRP